MIEPSMTIEGLQEAQAAMNKINAAFEPRGAYEKAVQFVTLGALSYLIQITHVDTGAYRAAHRSQFTAGQEPRGIIYVDPSARNPRSGRAVSEYAVYEEDRGGSHAAYKRTVDERGDALLAKAGAMIEAELPRGAR